MEGIEFEIEEELKKETAAERLVASDKSGPLVKLVLKMGGKDPVVANIILLAISAVFFGVTIYLYADILGISKRQAPTIVEPSTILIQ